METKEERRRRHMIEYRRAYRQAHPDYWRKRSQIARRESGQHKVGHNVHKAERVPEADILARLAEIPDDTRGLTARMMGDPIFPRSALAKS